MQTKFATPGQRQMWLDAISNISIEPLPAEYASETWDEVPSDEPTISDEELEAITDGISDEELDEAVKEEASVLEENNDVGYGIDDAADNVENSERTLRTLKEYKSGKYKFDMDKDTKSALDKHIKAMTGVVATFNKWKKEVWDIPKGSLISGSISVSRQELNDNSSKQTAASNFIQTLYKLSKGGKLNEESSYTYDADLKAIKIESNGWTVHGLYNTEYEDLFYKIWIEANGKVVYKNDYGKEVYDVNEISDGVIDNFLDDLIEYAMKTDPNLHESFQIVEETIEEEETLEEDFSNIATLQNFKGKSMSLKLKDGSTIDVASDEAKIIATRYAELQGDLQKKFADLLNKSQQSFLIAYKDAMK